MKTFARLIWRYVLTAVGVVLLLLVLTISLLGWISWREGYLQRNANIPIAKLQILWLKQTMEDFWSRTCSGRMDGRLCMGYDP